MGIGKQWAGLGRLCPWPARFVLSSQIHIKKERGMCMIVNFKAYGSVQALNQVFGNRWVYIGRTNNCAGLPASPLANPFKVKDYGGRGQTLPHYRHWLWQHIQNGDEDVINALKAIDEQTVLICWCKPGPCHGDVVKAAAAWLQKQES
jgi:hypothetical protein